MAKLCRSVKLNDRFDAQVFTFTLPKSVVREFSPDIFSTEIVYGYHKWNVSFVKSEKHLGAYLKLLTPSAGLVCRTDYSFTCLNKDHFTRNESFMEKNCDFTPDVVVHGRKTFIGLSDMNKRNFIQDSGEFLVELEIRSVISTFVYDLSLPKGVHSISVNEKLETPYFSFGVFDWSVSLFNPSGAHHNNEGKTAVQLNRHTSFDHLCNVKYEIALGEDDMYQTGLISQTLDTSGVGDPLIVAASIYELSQGTINIPVKVIMRSVVSVSEVTMDAFGKSCNRAHCYDRDKQAWMIEGDATGKCLAFRLYYTDISHVPRKFARFVCWNISVLTNTSGSGAAGVGTANKVVKALDGPFNKYYVQQDLDEGFVMHTNIPVEMLLQNGRVPDDKAGGRPAPAPRTKTARLQDADNVYYHPDEERKLTIHIEWISSCLLVRPTYHTLDDVSRVHKQQMLREIMALQAENYALEKQLYSYQQSIAKTNAKSSPGGQSPNVLEDERVVEEQEEYVREKIREVENHRARHSATPTPTPGSTSASPAPTPTPQPVTPSPLSHHHQQQQQQPQHQQQQPSPPPRERDRDREREREREREKEREREIIREKEREREMREKEREREIKEKEREREMREKEREREIREKEKERDREIRERDYHHPHHHYHQQKQPEEPSHRRLSYHAIHQDGQVVHRQERAERQERQERQERAERQERLEQKQLIQQHQAQHYREQYSPQHSPQHSPHQSPHHSPRHSPHHYERRNPARRRHHDVYRDYNSRH